LGARPTSGQRGTFPSGDEFPIGTTALLAARPKPLPERVFIKIKSAAKAASKSLLCNELHSNMFIECH
jgi:hypothetical protein